jgi:hypothetical protein
LNPSGDASKESDFPKLARFVRKLYAPLQVLTVPEELLGNGTIPSDISRMQH